MKETPRTKQALIQELASFRRRIAELEKSLLDRKYEKDDLRNTEMHYYLLFEQAQDGIALADEKTGKIVDCNEALCHMTERVKADLLGQHQSILHSQKHLENGHSPSFLSHRAGDPGQALEDSLSTKNGKMIPVEIRASRVRMKGRDYLLGIFRDISDRKRMKAALKESEERLRRLVNATWEGIIIHGEGTVLDVNEAILSMTGYSYEELIGHSVLEFLAPESIEPALQKLREGIDGPEIYLEAKALRKDKTVFPIEVLGRPIRYKNYDARVIAVRDITQRKQAEEELERYRKHLEDMVMERTAELETKNITLQELNTTLKVLLKQRENDKKDIEEKFVMNVRNLVLPFVEQMKKGRLNAGERLNLDIIETHLHEIATPLLKNMRQFNLTPREIKVAVLVKDGMSTKEIAETLKISKGSIDIHRKNIRKKLGLTNRRANLQSYLESLEQ